MPSPPPPKRARHEYGLMRPHGFVGSASGIHFIQTVYNAVSKSGSPAHAVPGEDDQLSNNTPEASIWKEHELSRVQGMSWQLQDLLDCSQTYFDHWQPAFPFLHAPTVVQWLSEISGGPDTIDMTRLGTMQSIVVRSIMSISLADSRQSGHRLKLPPTLVFQSWEEAFQGIQPVLIKRPSIESLQAAMSLQLFLISMLRLNGASRIQGIIIRMILQMGLHRCPRRYQTFTSSEAVIRQRIFWSAYIVDRYLSQCLGLPITLRDDDVDVCSMDYECHISAAEKDTDMDDRLAFSCFIAKHARMKGRVIELCNKSISHRQSGTEAFQRLNIEITKWANDVEEYIECRASQATSVNPTQRLILSALKHEIIISLNRPLLTAIKSSPEYNAAMQTCISASRSLIVELRQGIFRKDITSSPSLDSTSDIRNFISWPFLTWAVWISAFLVLFAAVEKEISKIAAVKLSDQSIEILKHLSARGSVWANACAAAIHDLSIRFTGKPHSNSEQSRADATFSHVPITADTSGSTATDFQRQSLPAKPAEQCAQKSADLSTTSTAASDETNIDIVVDSNPRTAFSGAGLPNTGLTTHMSPYPHNSGDMSLETMFSTGYSSEQTDLSLFEGFDIPFWVDDDEYASLAIHWDMT